ncbi:recombinase family protein [Arthrobacter globiformis]|uniref:recombinase family protein n=1 Tax=Arthrobacter globiformis TaxID=1665 RepID=UPI00278157EB|nr:recombinase family protein [Arthrobacter globiformis]MDQ0864729.1 hypothetical protein [Arthrobacter globiformis]
MTEQRTDMLEGIQLDRIYTDKASGKDTKRLQLEELLRFSGDGDTLVVHSMDRLAGRHCPGESPEEPPRTQQSTFALGRQRATEEGRRRRTERRLSPRIRLLRVPCP